MEQKYHWIIDNGHGSIDPTQFTENSNRIDGEIQTAGKRSPIFPEGHKFEHQSLIEGENNRSVVNYLCNMLLDKNVSHEKLVDTYKDITLTIRCQLANNIARKSSKPCILISVHHNAYGQTWNNANGISSHYFEKGDRYSTSGKKISKVFQPNLVEITKLRDRGYKGSNFKILRDTSMPALLTECGFMTNLTEATIIKSERGKYLAALAHLNSIIEIEKNGI